MELTISKYRNQLDLLNNNSDLNKNEKEEKKRQIVKKICDLKFKLAKFWEDVEYEDTLKDLQAGDLTGNAIINNND